MTSISMAETPQDAVEAFRAFMAEYQTEYHRLYCDVSYSWWDAMITGTEEAFSKYSDATLQMSLFHSSKEKFETLKRLIAETSDADGADGLTPIERRAADVALRNFEQNQFPPDLMERMTKLSSEIEQTFQTQRGVLDGREFTNNELLEMLEKETDSKRREEIWNALKQVGELVADRIVELAKIRNEAARALGYKNYWEMI